MNIFGFEINRIKNRVPGTSHPQPGIQLRPSDGQGLSTKYFNQFVPRKVQPWFFEFLVETIPIFGAAIERLVTLDGVPIVTGNNEKLVEEIREWIQHVPVNGTALDGSPFQAGLQSFHQGITREAFEQGFGVGEFITDARRSDIVGLRVADSKFIKFSRDGDNLRLYQKADNDLIERELSTGNLVYFAIGTENQNPYGSPIFRGCETVSKIMATVYNSTQNAWERFGDPSFNVTYKTSKKDGVDLEARRVAIANDLNTAVRAKREGKSADFVRAIDLNSEITVEIIGADGQLLEMEIPMRQIIQDICGKTGLPSWMLGYSFSTTERRANFEAEMVLSDVSVRQAAKQPHFERLITTMLRLRGRTWKSGDWKLEWQQVNLHDMVAQAQARFLNAQADRMQSTAGKAPVISVAEVPKKSACDCGSNQHSKFNIQKSTKETLPTPWPQLDQVESSFESRLKADWQELSVKIFTIAKLDPSSIALGFTKAPDEPFTLSEEQRAQIFREMEGFIGEYHFDNPDSPLKMYYGESYSLGLIQAAHMIGEGRPLLDIIKNSEIFAELVRNGFQLVSDNATKAITDKIMTEMQAHTIAGTNPLNVAERLKTIFGNQNSNWERLARTEMALAAETAKTNEWQAYGVKMVEFYPAPDACPICLALRGDYKLAECPTIPVHPRCRCSKRPAKSETA
jgi:SPP1 gp7 family putative phage head morphogenesis protein